MVAMSERKYRRWSPCLDGDIGDGRHVWAEISEMQMLSTKFQFNQISGSFFLSLYTARPSFEFYRQVYFGGDIV